MPYSHTQITLRGYHFEDASFGFNLNAAITEDDIGKAVTIDTAAANTVKLAGDDDEIIGRLATFENRSVEGTKVGAVELRFANTLPVATGATIAVGDTAVGAGDGEVRRLEDTGVSAPDYSKNFVAEIVGNFAVVVKA